MKQLKDYLHYYIGCELKTDTGKVTLIGVLNDKFNGNYQIAVLNGNITYMSIIERYKPILRRLEDITEDEADYIYNNFDVCFDTDALGNPVFDWDDIRANNAFAIFHYLLKESFDLFNLIDENLAIDKKTLNG